jgi:hypothetical protein
MWPRFTLASALSVAIIAASAHAQDINIGYIPGRGADAGNEEIAWERSGLDKTNIKNDADYAIDNLNTFDVISIGVVSYDSNEELQANFENLKEYVDHGGYLVTIDFQQDNSWNENYLPHKLALLDPDLEDGVPVEVKDHPIWKTPNQITEDHFAAGIWGGADFMADGPQEAPPPWEPLLLAGPALWPVIVGAEAGSGYVVFNSLQVIQSVGNAGGDEVVEVMHNLLLWRGVRDVEARGKLATAWGAVKSARR